MSDFNPDVVVIGPSGGRVRVEITIMPAVSVEADDADVVDVEATVLELVPVRDETTIVVETPEQVTPREAEVLRLVAEGYTNRQVAERLSISVRTVESHRANLMGKLGLEGRIELMRYAREHGLV